MTQIEATYHEHKPEFLRWQVRVPHNRFEYYPVYENDDPDDHNAKILGYKPSERMVKVERLIGWGETRNAAVRMAMGREA